MRTRRQFLETLGAAGAGLLAGGCEIEDVARLVEDARTDARIGVLANTEIGWLPEMRTLEKALRYYRQEKVDAVVITGKVTRNGYKDQLDVLDRLWKKVFGGSPARLIAEEGRHDINGFAFMVVNGHPVAKADVPTFHGYGKHALTDDLRFFEPDFNAIYAGSMSGIDVQDGYDYCGKTASSLHLGGAQGLLVNVYSSRVSVRRLDFTQDTPVDRGIRRETIYAEDVAAEFSFERGQEPGAFQAGTPRFWPDTGIRVVPGFVGRVRMVTVKWPHVLARYTGARAFSYEVTVCKASDRKNPFRRKNVLSRGFMLSEQRDTDPVACLFTEAELAVAGQDRPPIVVAVTPIGTTGERGTPVYSEPFSF